MFSGTVTTQTAIGLPDDLSHALVMATVSGTHQTDDPNWAGAKLTYYGMGDVWGGNGKQTGYFFNLHMNGDTTFGTFDAIATAVSIGGTQVEGSWQLQTGTGTLVGITGGGTFQARSTSPVTVEMTWEGEYTLPEIEEG